LVSSVVMHWCGWCGFAYLIWFEYVSLDSAEPPLLVFASANMVCRCSVPITPYSNFLIKSCVSPSGMPSGSPFKSLHLDAKVTALLWPHNTTLTYQLSSLLLSISRKNMAN
jgi:hypothetical protein